MALADAGNLSTWETIARLAVGLGLGAVIGVEREYDGHEAGVRTHALLALGSALFGVLSVGAFAEFIGTRDSTNVTIDVSRIASYVVAGIGFLAGGAIVKNSNSDRVRGLTTAGSLYVTAGVGLAAGLGFYIGAIVGTVASFIMLALEGATAHVFGRRGTMSIRVVLQSTAAADEIARQAAVDGKRPRRTSRKLRDDGTTELTLVGVRLVRAEDLIEVLGRRSDVVELSYSAD